MRSSSSPSARPMPLPALGLCCGHSRVSSTRWRSPSRWHCASLQKSSPRCAASVRLACCADDPRRASPECEASPSRSSKMLSIARSSWRRPWALADSAVGPWQCRWPVSAPRSLPWSLDRWSSWAGVTGCWPGRAWCPAPPGLSASAWRLSVLVWASAVVGRRGRAIGLLRSVCVPSCAEPPGGCRRWSWWQPASWIPRASPGHLGRCPGHRSRRWPSPQW